MSELKQKRFFPVLLLLLACAVFMGGGCVGGDSSSSGGSSFTATIPPPDEIDLGSHATSLDDLRSVDVTVSISTSEEMENVVCVMHIISGEVAYDPVTFRVPSLQPQSSQNGRGSNGDDDKSWVVTALIPKVTPEEERYKVAFDLANGIMDDISGQFPSGIDVSAVFYINENWSNKPLPEDEEEELGRGDDADAVEPEYFFAGRITTPEYDPDKVFKLDIDGIEIESSFLLEPTSEDFADGTYFPPTSSQRGEIGLFIGIPVRMNLVPENTAITSISIKSALASGNIVFGGNEATTLTRIFPPDTVSIDASLFVDEPSELILIPNSMDFQLSEDDETGESDSVELKTFPKRQLDDGEYLGVSFILGVKILGIPEDIWGYLSDNGTVALNMPITVEAEYAPEDAIAGVNAAEGTKWTSTADTHITEDTALFTADLALFFEDLFKLETLPEDYVDEGGLSRAAARGATSIYDYDKASVWDYTKKYSQSAGKEKYFKSGVEMSGKVYVRTPGAGLKVNGSIPLVILSKKTNIIDATAAVFAGDPSKTPSGQEALSSAAGISIKAFGVSVYSKTWTLTTGNSVSKTGAFSVSKELTFKKSFYEFLVPLVLKAGARGELGIRPEVTFKSISDVTFVLVPFVKASAIAGVELNLLIIRAGIKASLTVIRYEFKPKLAFGLEFKQAQSINGKMRALGIRTKPKFILDNTISTLDGYLKLYLDRRKYVIFGKWVKAASYNLLSWGGWSKNWNLYNATVVDTTFWID